MSGVTLSLVAEPTLRAEALALVHAMGGDGLRIDLSIYEGADDPMGELTRGEARLLLVPAEAQGPLPTGVCWASVPTRIEPRDVLVPVGGASATLRNLAAGSRVGVAGARRRSFLLAHRPDVEPVALVNGGGPGAALASGSVDAAILGAVEAKRSELAWRATELLDPKEWIPGPRQGALVLLAREDDEDACNAARKVEDPTARAALLAEGEALVALGVPSRAPLGVLALPHGRWIRLWAMVASADGRRVVRGDLTASLEEPEAAGRALADLLLARGAGDLLNGSAP